MKNYQYSATSAPPASPNPNTTTSSSTPPPPHSLASLPPDLFAECLHFLPPAEISRASLQLSKSLRNEGSSERAAWLAIKHMASIAERWTREQNDNLMEVDPEAAEARQLLKDHAMFGPFIGAKGIDTKSTGSKDDGITRFEDESWSILYKLVHDVLIKSPDIDEKVAAIGDTNDRGDDDDTSDNDEGRSSPSSTTCSIALTMWLAFGQPNLPPLSSDNHQSLSLVANCIYRALTSRSEDTNQHRKKLKSRAIQMALRLGQVGCWDAGSSILDQTIDEQVLREAKDDDSSSNSAASAIDPTPIDIDCAISVTTFLVDRLYSQTYVRDSDGDTRALSRAAQLGRWAVRKASSRHAAFLEKQRNNSDRPSIARDNFGEGTISNRISSSNNIPPPPVTSIFSNDCMRYLNALLAQAKALALLAQHVALGATDVRRLEFFPNPRHPLTINPSTEREVTVATHIVASQFFSDSEAIFSIPPAVMREQEPYQNEKDGNVFLRLTCAFQASRGEHFYCAASANTRWSHPIFTPLDTDADADDDPIAECIRRSIRLLKETFEMIMSNLYEAMNLDEELLSLAMRTAKDLGKACDFAERTGNANIALMDAGMYLDFAYLCSCFLLGSKHPSTMNIKRLHRIATEDTQTIAGRHNRVMAWLVDNFGPRNDAFE